MFMDMFQDDLDAGFGASWTWPTNSGLQFANDGNNGNKRGNSAMNSGKAYMDGLEYGADSFCFGVRYQIIYQILICY